MISMMPSYPLSMQCTFWQRRQPFSPVPPFAHVHLMQCVACRGKQGALGENPQKSWPGTGHTNWASPGSGGNEKLGIGWEGQTVSPILHCVRPFLRLSVCACQMRVPFAVLVIN